MVCRNSELFRRLGSSGQSGRQGTEQLRIKRGERVKLGLAVVICLALVRGWSQQTNAVDTPFRDEPAAHQLYTEMVQAMRQAKTLSWTGDYRWGIGNGPIWPIGVYRIWLKKPNYARVEFTLKDHTKPRGILVGDGDYFWIYWPEGKFRYGWEKSGKYAEEYEKYQNKFFIKKRSPVGMHSIGHEVFGYLGLMTILDPSTFHGYTDSLQAYIDGVRSLGSETIGGEVCDGVELSIMKHQRSWHIWLARKDRLPRKVKQVVRLSSDSTVEELFSEVAINAEISNDRFAWSAPKDWKEWKQPAAEEGLLKPGTMAPDFELAGLDGGKLKLSNFRGQIVWLNKWRCG